MQGHTRLQDLTHQGLRHAVAMPLKFNVMVNVNFHRLEDCKLPRLLRQWLQGRCIQLRKCARSATRQFLERLVVEHLQQWHDRFVDIVHAVKPLMAQSHQDPALHNLHRRLHLGLILWVAGSCGQHRGGVVTGEVAHRLIDARLISIRVGNHGLGVVGHDQQRHATEEVQRLDGRVQPVGHSLAWRCASIGVARCTQGRHEDVGSVPIGQCHRWPRVINEQLFASAVDLAH